MHFVGPCVTIFGSARFKEGSANYEKAREVAARISSLGLTVMTGGGPGIMEAANRGAYESGGMSVGVSVVLPHEQVTNPYTHKSVTIRYFFIRKVLLLKYSIEKRKCSFGGVMICFIYYVVCNSRRITQHRKNTTHETEEKRRAEKNKCIPTRIGEALF